MTAEMDQQMADGDGVQIALDGMPAPANTTTLQINGPADAAFQTTHWGLDQVRQQLAMARADKKRLAAFIAALVKQEKYLSRMARIAHEFAQDQEAVPAEE